jgi:alkaline phosphatase D
MLIQVGRTESDYCAYDAAGGTFMAAINDLGEDANSIGTNYESWGEIPQERNRLLRKCQKAINDGFAKVILFYFLVVIATEYIVI